MLFHSLFVLASTWFPRDRAKPDEARAEPVLVWERHPVEQQHLREEARRQIDQWYWNRRA